MLEEAAINPKQAKVSNLFQCITKSPENNYESAIKNKIIVNVNEQFKECVSDRSMIENEFISVESNKCESEVNKFCESEIVTINVTSNNNQNEKIETSITTFSNEFKPLIHQFENDKGLYENYTSLDEDNIRALLLAGPCQPKECDMPDKKFNLSNDKRHFSSSLYFKNKKNHFVGNNCSPWLSYSPTKHYAYCHYCWLFGDESAKKSSWYTGFTNWKHCHQSSIRHGLSKVHLNNAVAAATFLQKADIRHKLNHQISEEAKKWNIILNILFDVVKTLSGLGVAFRGHRENLHKDEYPGIYLTIIKLISHHNPILHSHIESPNRIKYLSKTIMYELLSILADQTRKAIVDECKDAKFFTLLADSTTDVAHLDQMAILLRYVLIKNEDNEVPKVCIKESFLCYIQLKKGNATFICNEVVTLLFEKYGFRKNYLCGQGYDGAAVMAGNQSGLQAKIKEYVGNKTFIPYVHCTAHQLNLVLVHAAEDNSSPSIKVFFATIQKIFNYFAHSHRRWEELLQASRNPLRNSNGFGILLLKELKKEIFVINNQMENYEHEIPNVDKPQELNERILHIKGLSTTRWAARLKAVEAVIQNIECIVECLEREISRDEATGDDIMVAQSLLSSVNWLFFLNLLWWHSVLEIVNITQLQLQRKEIDLIMAQNCILTALSKLKQLRSENVYNNFISKAKRNWEKMSWVDADFPVVRKRRVKKMADERTADCSLETPVKHRVSYYEVLDTMCSELQERATGFKDINDVFGFLMPESLKKMKQEDFETSVSILINKYGDFFTTDLKYELISFVDLYFSQNYDFTDNSPLQYLEYIIEKNLIDSFPECNSLFRLFLTLPVSTASVERVMSSLKRIKEHRRATLTEETLNEYSILYIERSVANKINLDSTIEIFAEQKARRQFITK